jgi:hypothetical protein
VELLEYFGDYNGSMLRLVKFDQDSELSGRLWLVIVDDYSCQNRIKEHAIEVLIKVRTFCSYNVYTPHR